MKRYRVIFSKRVRAEIKEAMSYIALDSPQQAEAWGEDIIEVIQSLETMPHRCSRLHHGGNLGADYRELLHQSYRIIFVVDDEEVRIVHVRHMAREPWSPERRF